MFASSTRLCKCVPLSTVMMQNPYQAHSWSCSILSEFLPAAILWENPSKGKGVLAFKRRKNRSADVSRAVDGQIQQACMTLQSRHAGLYWHTTTVDSPPESDAPRLVIVTFLPVILPRDYVLLNANERVGLPRQLSLELHQQAFCCLVPLWHHHQDSCI